MCNNVPIIISHIVMHVYKIHVPSMLAKDVETFNQQTSSQNS